RQTFVSLDDSTGEDRYRLEPADAMDPEKLFERKWAEMVLDRAKSRLEEEYLGSGKGEHFQRIKPLEFGDRTGQSYAEIGAVLGLAENGVKTAASRMRKRYSQLIREEVANTVATPDEVDEEIRYLIGL